MRTSTVFWGRLFLPVSIGLFLAVKTADEQMPDTSRRAVLVILMENHNWSSIKGSPSAPYINNMLLPIGAHAAQYYNTPKLHPNEPNYITLESVDNFGIRSDESPITNQLSTANHRSNLLYAS